MKQDQQAVLGRQLLAASGVKVVINSVKSVEKEAAIAAVLDDSIYCQANIAIEDDCKNLIDSTIRRYGQLEFFN